jgi:hypothetical protein
MRNAACGTILDGDSCLASSDIRDDFEKDFAQLLTAQWDVVYPPKDYSTFPDLMTVFDLNVSKDSAAAIDKGPKLSTVSGDDDKLVKVQFGALTPGVDEPGTGGDE